MKHAFRSALVITGSALSSQLVLFVCQLVAAAQFGASSDMDAFLAASTMPQFIMSVLIGSLGFVFIPFFVEHFSKGDEEAAFKLATGLFNNCILLLGVLSVIGILFARQILEITTPGLPPETLETSLRIAIITWPTVVATGAVALLTSIYQARKDFTWQAIVPFIGAVANLILLVLLSPHMGIMGLAVATTLGVVLQCILLLRVFGIKGRYRFQLYWTDELYQILRIAAPLILVALLSKFTTLLDRFLASDLEEGTISQLNYAFRMVTLGSLVISTGISTVIFPKLSLDVSRNDFDTLRETLSFGLRIMWAVVAPVITIGAAISLPVIILMFNRGEFTMEDSIGVSGLLKIYLLALTSMCLGTLTSKVFYAMKDTKTLAVFGMVESIAYIVYTIYLTRAFGSNGIAYGFVIYFSLSLLWQIIVLHSRLGNSGAKGIIKSFGRTAISAILAGGAALLILGQTEIVLLQAVLGALAGGLTYIFSMHLLGSSELNLLRNALFTGNRE